MLKIVGTEVIRTPRATLEPQIADFFDDDRNPG
jgi:hypothetical protein